MQPDYTHFLEYIAKKDDFLKNFSLPGLLQKTKVSLLVGALNAINRLGFENILKTILQSD